MIKRIINSKRKKINERIKFLERRIKEGNNLNMSASGYQQDLKIEQRKQFLLSKPKNSFPVQKQRINFIQTLNPAPALSQEQSMLQELFNGERTFGTGQNLPEINGILRTGGGLMNNGDYESETASMFGFKPMNSFGFNQGEGGY